MSPKKGGAYQFVLLDAHPSEFKLSCNSDRVTVHYIGTLKDGTAFDSIRDRLAWTACITIQFFSGSRGFPFQTASRVGTVMRGWDVI
jgi:hypothetical protein